LLRQIAVGGAKVYFDTNTSNHRHFVLEGDEPRLVDIPSTDVVIDRAPSAPQGCEFLGIEIVVRLKKLGKTG
jgi:Fur family iron response transcriptional regulator